MSTAATATDFRHRALLCALADGPAERVEVLLRWHPSGEELLRLWRSRGSLALPLLPDLLWDELAAHAARLPFAALHEKLISGGAHDYWMRRRQLGRLADWPEEEKAVATFWRTLLGLTPDRMEAVCSTLGIEMIGYAMLLEAAFPQKVIQWLSPLGSERARRVVDQFERLKAHPIAPELSERWHHAFSRVRHFSGDQMAHSLGLGLLSALYQRLPEAVRGWLDPVLGEALHQPSQRELCLDGEVQSVNEIVAGAVSMALAQRDR